MKILSKSNNIKNNNSGFTLIELLATIAILSVVLSISIYFVYEIVDNTKNKSYLVTINNIEKQAGTYAIENSTSVRWINANDMSYQYQCVSIQNLIDSGYFSGDVLNSKVDKDVYVQKNDMIYLERNIDSKTITNNVLLVGNRTDFSGLCSNISSTAIGNITFKVEPSGWAKEKDITIYYSISNNNDDVSKYTYSYNYFLEDDGGDYKKLSASFNDSTYQELVTVDKNGDLIAKINNGGKLLVSKALNVDDIDNIPPICTLSVTTDNISMDIDDNVGVINKGITTSVIPDYNGDTKIDLTTGIIYGYVKDAAGNTGSCSIDVQDVIYTCRKDSEKQNNTIGCTENNYNNESNSCPSGYIYNGDNCSRTVYYNRHYKECRTFDKINYAFVETWESGSETCDVQSAFTCDANNVWKSYIYMCEALYDIYDGVINCYEPECSTGTLIDNYCYLSNRNSCPSGWFVYDKYCVDNSYVKVGNYCYK